MKILKDTFRPEMARIKREIAALRSLTVHVGIMGDAGGDLLMIAGVHEYGATIHAKNVKHLAIPLTAEAKDAGSPRSFSDLEFIPISPGYGYLVREKPEAKGKAYDPDNYDWLYMLVESVEIPERSFIRASFDNGGDTLEKLCKEAVDGIIRKGWKVGRRNDAGILQHEVIPRKIGDDAADNNAVSAPFRFRPPLQQHHIPRGRRRCTMRTWKGPKLPRGLLHEMFEVHEDGGYYDKQNGGQWVPGGASEEAFQGVVMPLNNEDLKYMDAGTYTINAQKVYTNGHTLRVGAQFRDGYDGQLYTVKQELTHGPVHALKRYMVEKKGASNPK